MTRAGRHALVPDLAAIVLAAGAGRRLAPLSDLRPKPLCPVGNRALLDLAVERVADLDVPVAVNLHHGAAALRAHLEATSSSSPVHLSEEQPEALGTAGALAGLRSWIDGRDVLVVNADTWAPGPLAAFVAGWDRSAPAVLVHGSDRFGPRVGIVANLLPWSEVERLEPEPSGLYEVVWRRRQAEGRLQVVRHDGPFVDCGTAVDLLEANLAAAALAGGALVDASASVAAGSVEGRSVVGAGATVLGRVVDSVLWPGTTVAADEVLVRCVRASAALTLGPLDDASALPG